MPLFHRFPQTRRQTPPQAAILAATPPHARPPHAPRVRLAAAASAAASLALGLCLAAPAAAEPWRQLGYDAGGSFYNPREVQLTASNVAPLRRIRQTQLGQFYVGPVTQADGQLLVCSNLLGLANLGQDDHLAQWTRVGLGGNCGSVTLDNLNTYVTASSFGFPNVRTVSSVVRATGALRWQVTGSPDPAWPTPSYLGALNPTLAQGLLVVPYGRSLVEAREAATGALRWAAETGALQNDVAVADGRVFLSAWGGEQPGGLNRLTALDLQDGRLLWQQAVDGTHMEYPPVAIAGRVFVGANSGLFTAHDAATGRPLWQRSLAGGAAGRMAATPEVVVALHGAGTLTALRARDGKTVWTRSIVPTESFASNLVLAGELLVYVADTPNGLRLRVMSARTGKLLSKPDDGIFGSYAWVQVSNGRVHVADNQGYLNTYALP